MESLFLKSEDMRKLEVLSRGHNTQQKIVTRSNILLLANEGKSSTQISRQLNISRAIVYTWFNRWIYGIESALPISTILDDETRLGAPCFFSPETQCQLFAMACEKPSNYGRQISHWSARELADEMIKQNLVKTISARHVQRLLNDADIKPHKMKYYLHSEKDENFDIIVSDINNLYANAQSIAAKGGRVISNDEKTGIQALERTAPNKPVEPGKVERQEFNYKRNGTLSLIANLDIASGKILYSSIGPTRNEIDFKENIHGMILNTPEVKKWHIICDNLNTHQSESLVNLVADIQGIGKDYLGLKGVSGILKSQKSRKEFLVNKDHDIVFHYTPKHASWMNQVEIWFSILVRKLIKRESFHSTENLKTKIMNFIKYFNETMAKPFKWTYKGRALKA